MHGKWPADDRMHGGYPADDRMHGGYPAGGGRWLHSFSKHEGGEPYSIHEHGKVLHNRVRVRVCGVARTSCMNTLAGSTQHMIDAIRNARATSYSGWE